MRDFFGILVALVFLVAAYWLMAWGAWSLVVYLLKYHMEAVKTTAAAVIMVIFLLVVLSHRQPRVWHHN